MNTERSFRFRHAIVRTPPRSAVVGLRGVDTGTPDVDLMREHHSQYISALQELGLEVTVLDPEEDFPDSGFVEDSALCLPEGAIVLRPGAETRMGEADLIEPVLERFYFDVRRIRGPGTIDGGDILVTESEILVGQSERTNTSGIEQLRQLVSEWGYLVREVLTPPGVLHFKTHCSLLDGDTILSTRLLSDSGCFSGYTVIDVAEDEIPAANTIRVNDAVVMPEGFPETKRRVEEAGFRVITVPNSECQKIDGGVSCLSLRFSPNTSGHE